MYVTIIFDIIGCRVDGHDQNPYPPVMLAGMVSAARTTQGASTETSEVTNVPKGNLEVDFGGAPQAKPKIEIRVKLDCTEERLVELEQGACITELLEIVAADSGCSVEELVLTREGEDTPLAVDVLVDTSYPQEQWHHVHYSSEVKVTVYYQASQGVREFKRFEAVKDVLAWAIVVFKVDASLATELVLVRRGKKDELPEREHIGHLVGKDSDLALDLVRGDIANGSCS